MPQDLGSQLQHLPTLLPPTPCVRVRAPPVVDTGCAPGMEVLRDVCPAKYTDGIWQHAVQDHGEVDLILPGWQLRLDLSLGPQLQRHHLQILSRMQSRTRSR